MKDSLQGRVAWITDGGSGIGLAGAIELVRAGAHVVISGRNATTNAAKALGMEAQLGTVAAGKFADLVAFGANPLSDLKVLASPVFVMQDGKVVRNDAVKH